MLSVGGHSDSQNPLFPELMQNLHEQKESEENAFETAVKNDSWFSQEKGKGHPMGSRIGDLKLHSLGLMGLARFCGGGVFAGELNDAELQGLEQDPLALMSGFLSALSENKEVRKEWGLKEEKLQRLAETMQKIKKTAEELKNIENANNEDLPKLTEKFAEKLKSQLEKEGVVYFPFKISKGKCTQIVRIDKNHGFSVIEVDQDESDDLWDSFKDIEMGSIEDADILNAVKKGFSRKNARIGQSSILRTSIDPLNQRKVESLKAQKFISFEAKKKNKLGDRWFFEALIKGAMHAEDSTGAGFIYESLTTYVEGKRLESSDANEALYKRLYSYFDEEHRDASFHTISAALYYMCLDPFFEPTKGADTKEAVKHYKKIKFLFKSQMFMAYANEIEKEERWNTLSFNEKNFLKNVMTSLIRSAEKLQKIDAVGIKELRPFFLACKKFDGLLERPFPAGGSIEMEEVESLSIVDIEGGDDPVISEIAVASSDSDYAGATGVKGGVDQTREAQTVEEMILDISEFDYTLDVKGDEGADQDKQIRLLGQKIHHLTKICRRIKKDPFFLSNSSNKVYAPPALKEHRCAVFDLYEKVLGDFIAQIPVPVQGEDPHWSSLTEEQNQRYFMLMEDLTLLVQSFSTLQREYRPKIDLLKKGHSPDTTIMMLALQTVQLKLAAMDNDYHLKEQRFSYFEYLYEMRSKHFIVENPVLRKIANELMLYYNPNWSVEELTRTLNNNDFFKDDEALFRFGTLEKLSSWPLMYTLSNWRLSLEFDPKKKSNDQKFLEGMLDVEGVREGIKEIIEEKNARLQNEYDEKESEYNCKREDFCDRIGEIEAEIKEKGEKIDNWDEYKDDLQKFYTELTGKQQANLWSYHQEHPVLDERGREQGWLSQQDGERRKTLEESVKDIENFEICLLAYQLKNLNDDLRDLIERKPKHPGFYPVDSAVDQLCCLLTDPKGRELIPPKIDAIIQVVLRGQYLLTEGNVDFDINMTSSKQLKFWFSSGSWGPIDPTENGGKRKDPISVKIDNSVSRIRSCTLTDTRKTRKAPHLRQSPLAIGPRWESYRRLYLERNPNANVNFIKAFFESHRSDFARLFKEQNSRLRKAYSSQTSITQNTVMFSSRQFFDLPLDQSRSLQMLDMDPFDTVNRIIGFFQKNITLISNPFILEYIRFLFFNQERILSQIYDNPRIGKKINAVIVQAVQHYKDEKDIDTALALIRLGDQLKRAVQAKTGNISDFSDYRSVVLNELIPFFADDTNARLKAYRTLVQLHAYNDTGSLDEEEKEEEVRNVVSDILAMRVSSQLHTKGQVISDEEKIMEEGVLLRYQHLLSYSGGVDDRALTHAAKVVLTDQDLKEQPLDDESEWVKDKEKYNKYVCGRYEIYVDTGFVAIDGTEQTAVPKWIKDNQQLKKVYPFPIDANQCGKQGDYRYVLYPGIEDRELVVTSYDDGETIEIERKIGDKNYRYIETPEELEESMPTVFNGWVVCWAGIDVNNKDKIVVYQNDVKAYELGLKGSSKSFFQRFMPGKSDGEQKKGVAAITRLRDGAAALNFSSAVVKINEEEAVSVRELFAPLAMLETDSKYIECWRSGQNGEVKFHINFTRLGLAFEVRQSEFKELFESQDIKKGKQKESVETFDFYPIHCQNYPGYLLTAKTPVQSLNLEKSIFYATLVDEKGKKKVLLPNLKLEVPSEFFALSAEEPLQWYAFDTVKVKADGAASLDIESFVVEQQLVQIYLLASQRNFSKLKKILDKINPLDPHTEKELLLIRETVHLLVGYNHPEANALALKMLFLKDENAIKPRSTKNGDHQEDSKIKNGKKLSDKEKEELFEIVLKVRIYKQYRDSSQKVSAFCLTDEEERRFVENVYGQLRERSERLTQWADELCFFGIGQYIQGAVGGVEGIPSQFIQMGQKVKAQLSQVLSKNVFGLVEELLGDRYRDLSTKEGKLGMKRVKLLSRSSRSDWIGESKPTLLGDDLEVIFIYNKLDFEKSELPIPDSEEVEKVLNVFHKDKKYWKKNFYVLYWVARLGNAEQKEALQRDLEFATHFNSEAHRILKWVLEKPGRYPTIEKLNQKIRKWRVEAVKKVTEAEKECNAKTVACDKAQNTLTAKESAYTNASEEYNGYQKKINDTYRSVKELQRKIAAKKIDLKGLENKKYTEDFSGESQKRQDQKKVAASKTEIEYLEDLQEKYRKAQGNLKEAKIEFRRADKAHVKAKLELAAAEKKVEKAEAYKEKMEKQARDAVRAIAPTTFWLVINNFVMPFFRLLGMVRKSYAHIEKFLNRHAYRVVDRFASSKAKVSDSKETQGIDRSALKKIDQLYDCYFKDLIAEYFDIIDDADTEIDYVWNDPLFPKEVEALEEYRNEVRIPRKIAQLKDPEGLSSMFEKLEAKRQQESAALVMEKQTLVWQLNRVIKDKDAKLLMEMNRRGRKGALTWDDLHALTLEGDLQAFQEKTGLDEEQANILMAGVAYFLVKATRVKQMGFVMEKVRDAQAVKDEEKAHIYHTIIVEALALTRHYPEEDVSIGITDMERLWFEYGIGHLFWKKQIDKQAEVIKEANLETLMEAPTGFGKTKVFIPAYARALMKDFMVFILHPPTLQKTNTEDNQEQVRKSYGKKVDRLDCDRSTEFKALSLKRFFEDMQAGLIKNLSPEDMQALELKFLIALLTTSQKQKEGALTPEKQAAAYEEIGYFIRILRAIYVEGFAVIDESHVNMDPFSNRLIYTLGKFNTLEAYQVDIIEEAMGLLIQNPDTRILEDKQAEMTKDQFKGATQQIADHFCQRFGIHDSQKDAYNAYVFGKTDRLPSGVAKGSQRAEEIALVKGVLSVVLEGCMKDHVDEGFGLSILHFDDKKEFAIPFISADTPKENTNNPSQFQNEHETLIKTYFTYLYKGLKKEQVAEIVKQMREEQEQEFKAAGCYENTESNKRYKTIVGEDPRIPPLRDLKTKEQIAEVFPHFKKNPKAVFYYMRHFIVPQLELFDQMLVSTSQNLRSMFGAGSLSLSATPQDPAAHGPDTVMIPMKGTQGQVTHLFLKKVDQSQKIHRSKGSNPEKVLDSVVEKVLENRQLKAVIDTGGLLRGLSNEQIAKRFQQQIKEGHNIEAIEYFDVKKKKFVSMEVATGTLSDPEFSNVEKDKKLTLFDQARSFAADRKLDPTASALLLLNSKHITKAQAGQGAGRMRALAHDQGVEVMLASDDYDHLFDGEDEATIGKLLSCLCGNLNEQRAEENFLSLQQQMDNELRFAAMCSLLGVGVETDGQGKIEKREILDTDPDVEKALRMFGKFEPLLVTKDSTSPLKKYGDILTGKTPEECLDHYLKRTQAKARKISGFNRAQRNMLEERLPLYKRKWQKPVKEEEKDTRIPLPKGSVISSNAGLGTQVEVQVDAETDRKLDQKQEAQVQEDKTVEYRTPSEWPDSLDLFSRGWEKPRRKWVFLSGVAKSLSKGIKALSDLQPKNSLVWEGIKGFTQGFSIGLGVQVWVILSIVFPIFGLIGNLFLLGCAGYYLYKKLSGRVKVIRNHTYKVSDIMGIHLPRKMKKAARFYSPNLLVSNNFYVQVVAGNNEKPQEPFTKEQKPLFNVLVIQDTDKKGNKKLQVMLIDQNDSPFFRRLLQTDNRKTSQEIADQRSRKVAVYNVDGNTLVASGKNAFDEEELKKDPGFNNLISQAKIVNREIFMEEGELKEVTKQTRKVGKEFMHAFERDRVLRDQPSLLAIYEKGDSNSRNIYNAIQKA